ncbi:transmembrane protein 181 isoform X3 [Mastomys coucha]|uniref:transmembrane protein 181 isoform X3 n=1 Tax=Mastomys coucha TaxID=35658 RepID=UPI001262635B|nr:transmembrane protein 181 isoform X3 [Mastomys coucha]
MLARRCCVGKVTLSPQQLQPCPSQTRWHTHPLYLLPPKQAAWAISGTHCHLWGIKPSLSVLGKSPGSRSPCVLSFLCAEGTQSILLNHEDGVRGSPKGLFAAPGRNERDPLGHQNGTHSCSKCAEIIVAHLGYLNYTQYRVTVGFEHLNQPIKDMNFTWKTYNPAFSQLEIWFRFVFVVLTFIVICLFVHSLRKFSMRDWGIEQKWMSVLLALLLLYNDPFFPLSFLVNSWFPGMLDDFFQSLFLCALLLFWLCVYHGIRVQGERKCLTFYLPKFFIVGLLWLASVTLGIWQTFNELNDPMYQYRVDTGNFQGMKVFFMVVAAVYILYLLFLIVRACSELRHMPYVDLRLKFLTALTFVVLVISIVILYLRFGAQVLQDNFVAELSAHYQNSAEFLSFYGLLNFYLYTLAFVYSPSKNALYESQLKDNPAFSMLNDSDDDVIYGSDYEEMPLQNGQAIRAKCREESDSD